jgi:hypothetical protein
MQRISAVAPEVVSHSCVMAGLVPAIHVLCATRKAWMPAKGGHDE